MSLLLAVIVGYLLDLIFGDPAWMVQPVKIMGLCIKKLEMSLWNHTAENAKAERRSGVILVVVMVLGTAIVTGGICFGIYAFDRFLGMIPQVLWCWQALAAKSLVQHSRRVYSELYYKDLGRARKAVARMVGRDTKYLDEEGVTKACIESVAESTNDGVIAPLFYMMIGGAPLAMVYKVINTMDSMVGYMDSDYINFGRAAAKLDDYANWIPSRFAALCWVGAAALTGNDFHSAWEIWKRDRRNHLSPNAGQVEAACAGSLGIQLGGPHEYNGVTVDKQYIGDDTRAAEPEDILRANRMMFIAELLALIVCALLRGTIWFLIAY